MPGRAQGRAYSGAQLARGVLMFSVLWRGKRTPWDRGGTTFIPPGYDVCENIDTTWFLVQKLTKKKHNPWFLGSIFYRKSSEIFS